MKRVILPVLLSSVLVGGQMLPSYASSQPDLHFKVFNPDSKQTMDDASAPVSSESGAAPFDSAPAAGAVEPTSVQNQVSDAKASESAQPALDVDPSQSGSAEKQRVSDQLSAEPTTDSGKKNPEIASKLLQGYVRVVPSGTKIPIIMDTAVDSDTSQEGDEFSARSAEDLTIDGTTVVPAGSIIKGRIAQLNAPRHLNRCGSVALKFDTVTTPDNRQIPIVANLIARGGVVHARRGLKDVAIASGIVTLPALLGTGIGLLAGKSASSSSSSKITKPEGAAIGAAIGIAVGVAILLAKKGKKVDVRPGDELKIELAEDLRMPM